MNLRRLATCAAVIVTGWWLFADTYARHARPAGQATMSVSPGAPGTMSVDLDASPATIRFAHFGTFHDYQLWR
ncbi:MAG: hypothetical protein IH989_04390, partial [Planctomycetes bacterium]|nr:hypothetical protein [Planctomycetota bacterium]